MSACLEHDHRLLDAVLLDVEAFLKEGSVVAAAEHYASFCRNLDAHIEVEEMLLFPLFERATGHNGPTSVMRQEHAGLRRLLRALDGCFSGAAPAVDPLAKLEEVTRLLELHNMKEERVLYPAIDRVAANAGGVLTLVERVEAALDRPPAGATPARVFGFGV